MTLQQLFALNAGETIIAIDRERRAGKIVEDKDMGETEVNGLLLRRDIHSVFDAGYVTIDDQLRFVVSDRVRTDFNNGNEYRRLHGTAVSIPASLRFQPDREALQWHRGKVFLG